MNGKEEEVSTVWFDCGTRGTNRSTAPRISKITPTTTIPILIRTRPVERERLLLDRPDERATNRPRTAPVAEKDPPADGIAARSARGWFARTAQPTTNPWGVIANGRRSGS